MNQHVSCRSDAPRRCGEAPFADALIRLTRTELGSVHALPASQGHALEGSSLRDRYLTLFGASYLSSDVSFSAPVLDSFFRPRGCLARAQRLAADAFGADHTLFVTCGTTMANSIALAAMGTRNRRVLVDRNAHQSIHLGLNRAGADVTYAGGAGADRGLVTGDIGSLVEEFRDAALSGRPYSAVVLSASSYDGSLLRMPEILHALLENVDELDLVVDEAWSALNNFHGELRRHTALEAARRARCEHPGKRVRLYATQSAHKSMCALRQGSFLHIAGDDVARRRAEEALYAQHTTSPSLPILASLDLARAQASLEGEAMLDRCLRLAATLRALLADGSLARLREAERPAATRWTLPDPTKVVVDFSALGVSGRDARMRLFHDHGLYASRGTDDSLLLNIHAGVTDAVFARLLEALAGFDDAAGQYAFAADRLLTNAFVISYPPGIPIAVPGERTAAHIDEQLLDLRRSAIEVFAVDAEHATL